MNILKRLFPKKENDNWREDELMDAIHSYIKYWEKNEKAESIRAKLEGLAFSILVILDGDALATSGGFRLKSTESGKFLKGPFHEIFCIRKKYREEKNADNS